MSSRLPPIAPSNQTPEQAEVHQKIYDATSPVFGKKIKLTNSDGAFVGPFGTLL